MQRHSARDLVRKLKTTCFEIIAFENTGTRKKQDTNLPRYCISTVWYCIPTSKPSTVCRNRVRYHETTVLIFDRMSKPSMVCRNRVPVDLPVGWRRTLRVSQVWRNLVVLNYLKNASSQWCEYNVKNLKKSANVSGAKLHRNCQASSIFVENKIINPKCSTLSF